MSTGTAFVYGNARTQFATGAWNWNTLVVWGLLVDNTYTPLVNVDQAVSNIPASSIIARVGPMTGQSVSVGIVQGTLPQWMALINGNPAAAVVLYVKGANDSASPLIYYSSNGVGFPLALQGFNYAVANDLSQSGWFQV